MIRLTCRRPCGRSWEAETTEEEGETFIRCADEQCPACGRHVDEADGEPPRPDLRSLTVEEAIRVVMDVPRACACAPGIGAINKHWWAICDVCKCPRVASTLGRLLDQHRSADPPAPRGQSYNDLAALVGKTLSPPCRRRADSGGPP